MKIFGNDRWRFVRPSRRPWYRRAYASAIATTGSPKLTMALGVALGATLLAAAVLLMRPLPQDMPAAQLASAPAAAPEQSPVPEVETADEWDVTSPAELATPASPLSAESPRWEAEEGRPAETVAAAESEQEIPQRADGLPGLRGLPGGDRGTDAAPTASIRLSSPAPEVEAVETAMTEDEVLEMELALAREDPASFSTPAEPDPETPPAPEAAEVPLPALEGARVNQYVNLRAAADNDAEVLAVVPANAGIQAEIDCPSWCAVTWQGRRGYIYQSFISRD